VSEKKHNSALGFAAEADSITARTEEYGPRHFLTFECLLEISQYQPGGNLLI
jgi:hypothetical protein